MKIKRLLLLLPLLYLATAAVCAQEAKEEREPEVKKSYTIGKGTWTLLLHDNLYSTYWTYVPNFNTTECNEGFIWGSGVGLEYAYRDNRMVSLTYDTGINGLGYVNGVFLRFNQLELLHSFAVGRFVLGGGTAFMWKKWKYTPHGLGAEERKWKEPFDFSHWSCGIRGQALFRINTSCAVGVEYAPYWMWDKGFRGKTDHQLTVKLQIRSRLNRKDK